MDEAGREVKKSSRGRAGRPKLSGGQGDSGCRGEIFGRHVAPFDQETVLRTDHHPARASLAVKEKSQGLKMCTVSLGSRSVITLERPACFQAGTMG